jgi:hypothetical protein
VSAGRDHAGRISRDERGQSSIELLGMLPLLVTVTLVLGQLLAAGAAHELAGTAAQAAAMAILQGGDPADAARAAVPGWSRRRLDVRITGRAVRVRLRPLAIVPGTAGRLVATATADAGPRP